MNKSRSRFWTMTCTLLLLAGCSQAGDQAGERSRDTSGAVTTSLLQTNVAQSASPLPTVEMYKSPTCECCTGWADHLRSNGFTVIEHKRDEMGAIKARFGVSDKLASCHTASVGGYIIEGHVPARDVERLLRERPEIAGLTAPGMPMKSPGMQAAGLPPAGYSVLAFDKDGNTTVYHRY